MKKFRDYCERDLLGFFSIKTIRVMKLTLILSILTISQLWATETYSQMTKLSIKLEDVKISDALKEIENQSEFFFLYSPKLIDVERKVNIDVENAPIKDILTDIFDDKVNFAVFDRQIILSPTDLSLPSTTIQQKKIIGTITDEKGNPVGGVTILVKGTTNGSLSDIAGKYVINNVPSGSTLIFSFVGMITQEIPAQDRALIDVVLKETAIGLDEVVVVGYGTQRKGNLTGSIAAVNSDKLTIAPIPSITNSLAGLTPGLVAKVSSGQPGADFALLNIRGFSDPNDPTTNPLVIIDGVEDNLNNLDVSQVESVSILKDGASSIYGARAGNGVILVTTKRGQQNQKPVFTLNSSFTEQGSTKMLPAQSSGQRAELKDETWINQGKPLSSLPFSAEEIQKYYAGTDPNYPNTNWYDLTIRKYSPQQVHNLSVRGGSDRIKYYGFFGYTDQETIIKTNGGYFKRYNMESNVDAKITDNLTLSVNLGMDYENRAFSQYNLNNDSYLWNALYETDPRYPAYLPDRSKLAYGGYVQGSVLISSNMDLQGYVKNFDRNMRGGVTLEYNIKYIKGLKAKAFVNYKDYSNYNKTFTKQQPLYTYNYTTQLYTFYGLTPNVTRLDEGMYRASQLTQQYSLNYENTFGVHRVSGLLLFESNDYGDNSIYASRQQFLTQAIDQLYAGTASTSAATGSASQMGRASYVGRFNYSYKDRYLVETILRADASAKFPAAKRWGYFPSVSLGWVMSQEEFMKSISGIDNIKFRASFGQSGNDGVGNFQYLAGYSIRGVYILGDNSLTQLYSTGLANPNLTWEKMTIYNAGLDFSFLHRKIYGSGDVFYRLRDGIPASRLTSLPSTFGALLPPENLNSISTRGFEFSLGTAGKIGDLMYDVNGNISWSRSKWVHFEEPAYTDPDQQRLYQNSGQWTDRTIGYVSDKLFASQSEIDALPYVYTALQGNSGLRPGDVKYKDMNNDGKLDWKDMQDLGSGSMPHWIYGLNGTLKYKDFDLAALFQGAFGYTTNVQFHWASVLFYDSRWSPENENINAFVPRLGGSDSNGWDSDYHFKSTSYLRLKTISIGYTLPKKMLDRLSIEQLRIYLAGTNLFTLSNLNKYGIDPESPSGYGAHFYPIQRTYSVGVNVSF
jgi:TonB-linked SusC/RagA family outer membrane protein